MTNDTRSREEIERDIAQKRAALFNNISQLKESLSLGSVAKQVGQIGLKHTAGLGTSALKQAAKNPLPVATIVGGIIWLFLSNSKADRATNSKEPATTKLDEELHPYNQTIPENTRDDLDLETSEVHGSSGLFDSHPLVLGALALAAGAALGSILPRSKKEDELISSAQELMRAEADRLSEIAQTLKSEAETIISETKADLDSGAPENQTAADAVSGIAKEAADRMMSAAVSATKDTKQG